VVSNAEPGAMTKTVETMLAEMNPLDGERAVLAAMARQLAGVLDAMDPAMSARMSGQTAGQMLRVLDKLAGGGQPRRHQHREDLPAIDTAPTQPPEAKPAKPLTDEHWYPGFEDELAAEHLDWIIQKQARRRGLPVPGTQAYSRRPWAPSTRAWIAEQKERKRVNRPLAELERQPLAIVR
jgi:hypothetical protein